MKQSRAQVALRPEMKRNWNHFSVVIAKSNKTVQKDCDSFISTWTFSCLPCQLRLLLSLSRSHSTLLSLWGVRKMPSASLQSVPLRNGLKLFGLLYLTSNSSPRCVLVMPLKCNGLPAHVAVNGPLALLFLYHERQCEVYTVRFMYSGV